jgi:hypothetical protein
MKYKCDVCDSTNVVVKVEATAGDNVAAEISYLCNTCGEYAFYAYGYYQDDRCMFSLIFDNEDPFHVTSH